MPHHPLPRSAGVQASRFQAAPRGEPQAIQISAINVMLFQYIYIILYHIILYDIILYYFISYHIILYQCIHAMPRLTCESPDLWLFTSASRLMSRRASEISLSLSQKPSGRAGQSRAELRSLCLAAATSSEQPPYIVELKLESIHVIQCNTM